MQHQGSVEMTEAAYQKSGTAALAARARILDAARVYWENDADLLAMLPIPAASGPAREILPPVVESVPLPEWAADVGVTGALCVPAWTVGPGESAAWTRCDWWQAAAWFLDGAAERAYEERHGPIGSYSARLAGWDSRLWDRAWVNRIAMFLRRWAARAGRRDEEVLGPFPRPRLTMTHDLDAVTKTLAIRAKQSAFTAVNILRLLGRGDARFVRFAVSTPSYNLLRRAADLGEGRRGVIYVFAGGSRTSVAKRLIDPSYSLTPAVVRDLLTLARDGWTIGVHPSIDAWKDPEALRQARTRLEAALETSVRDCRQHWLRFSWSHTWAAQQEAGFVRDSTLGFNDRPGFRTAAALEYRPLGTTGNGRSLTTTPLMLMDSHLYDYRLVAHEQRPAMMATWTREVQAVGGTAAVLWHPHTLASDYGWEPGLRQLITLMAGGDVDAS
jgi:hypothetical protein